MKQKTIQTAKYLLIVDDSEIKEGGWHTCTYPEYPLEARYTDKFSKYDTCKGCKKIIAHLPIGDSPILDGVPLINN